MIIRRLFTDTLLSGWLGSHDFMNLLSSLAICSLVESVILLFYPSNVLLTGFCFINIGCATLSKPDCGEFKIAYFLVLMHSTLRMSPTNNAIKILYFCPYSIFSVFTLNFWIKIRVILVPCTLVSFTMSTSVVLYRFFSLHLRFLSGY